VKEGGDPRAFKPVDLAIPMFGYKNHIGIDRAHGLIRTWDARAANAHEPGSTMLSWDVKTRLESQLLRMNCQTFSTGFSSGHLAGLLETSRRSGWRKCGTGDRDASFAAVQHPRIINAQKVALRSA